MKTLLPLPSLEAPSQAQNRRGVHIKTHPISPPVTAGTGVNDAARCDGMSCSTVKYTELHNYLASLKTRNPWAEGTSSCVCTTSQTLVY